MEDQLNSGVIEPVDREHAVEPGTVHYLPHREVVRMDGRTTKLRVAFDASSKCSREFDILIRFRVHNVAITANVEKIFLHVSINPEQRNMLRFLWIDSIESDDPCIVILQLKILFQDICRAEISDCD